MHRNVKAAIILGGATLIVTNTVIGIRRVRREERMKRKGFLTEVGLDVAAIHNATDVINEQIERGEIRDMDTLRARVLDEVAFQKIAIREDPTQEA